jgi:hypothetical protein
MGVRKERHQSNIIVGDVVSTTLRITRMVAVSSKQNTARNLGHQRFGLHLRNGAGNKVWDNCTVNPDRFPCMDFVNYYGIEGKYLRNNVH